MDEKQTLKNIVRIGLKNDKVILKGKFKIIGFYNILNKLMIGLIKKINILDLLIALDFIISLQFLCINPEYFNIKIIDEYPEKVLYRVANYSFYPNKFENLLKNNNITYFENFTSTTKYFSNVILFLDKWIESHPETIIFKIVNPEILKNMSLDINKIKSYQKNENEVLIPGGTMFKVIKIEKNFMSPKNKLYKIVYIKLLPLSKQNILNLYIIKKNYKISKNKINPFNLHKYLPKIDKNILKVLKNLCKSKKSLKTIKKKTNRKKIKKTKRR